MIKQVVNTIVVVALCHTNTLAHAKTHKHTKTIIVRIDSIFFIFFSPFISEST